MVCLSLRGNVVAVTVARVEQALGVGVKEVHGEVDALQVAARSVAHEVVGLGGAGADHHRVEVTLEVVGGHVLADFHGGDERNALGFHLFQPPPHHLLLVELHVGNAVHEQSAGPIRPFVHRDLVAGAVELRRAGQTGGPGTDDRHPLSGSYQRRFGYDPALLETPVDNGALDGLDGHRVAVDAQDAGSLARGRAHPAGELGEVVGLVQLRQGFFPVVPVNQIVPVRYEIVQRTTRRTWTPPHGHTRVAERDAAIHASGALLAQRFRRHGQDKLVPVLQTFEGGSVRLFAPLKFHESCNFSHSSLETSLKL